MGSRLRHLRVARGSTVFVWLRADWHLVMYCRDLTSILPPKHHPYMHPLSTTHSHHPHGMSANLIKPFLKYSSQSHQHGSRLVGVPSVNPQPWRFTNNSLGFPHEHSLSVCLFLWVCVVCVFFLLYLSFYLCCERCMVCDWFCIHNQLFVLCLLFLFHTYLWHGDLVMRMTLFICLSSLSMCISIILISA